jgi:glycine cleavage system H protein
MPISGKVVDVNTEAIETPEILNEDSFNKGWLLKIEATGDASEQDDLLSLDEYKEELE